MEYITLNFTGCKYLSEIHKTLKDKFRFPDYYGENLSALWDCLRDYCDDGTHISIIGLTTLPKEFEEYMQKMMRILGRIVSEKPNVAIEIIS